MLIEVNIPIELELLIDKLIKEKILTKTKLKSFYRVYTALKFKHDKFNKNKKNNLFPVPSSYLRKFYGRYHDFIDILIKNNILSYHTIEKEEDLIDNIIDDSDIFDDKIIQNKRIPVKYYSILNNTCIRYKFLIDTDKTNHIIEIKLKDNIYKNEDWYIITKNSLEEYNIESKIGRCSFGRRLHTRLTHNINIGEITSYKTLMSIISSTNNIKFCIIDAVACQPTLLNNLMLEKNHLFNNLLDKDCFYEFISERFKSLIDIDEEDKRDYSKTLFCKWVNGDYFSADEDFKYYFDTVYEFVDEYKRNNGTKSLGSHLQRLESSIFIDDILSNITKDLGIKFALTIHDSIIVKEEDSDKLINYCNDKYNYMKFKKEMI